MLTKAEAASKLDITEGTLARWAKYGLVTKHAYDGYRHLYEAPGPNAPVKQCSRWNCLIDRAARSKTPPRQNAQIKGVDRRAKGTPLAG